MIYMLFNIPYNRFKFVTRHPCFVLCLCSVIIYGIGRVMQQRCYLARISDAELYQCKDPQLRCQYVIPLGNDGCPVNQKPVKLFHKVRIQIDEGFIKHLVELRNILIDRRKSLYLIHKASGISLTYVLKHMVLILTCLVDVF